MERTKIVVLLLVLLGGCFALPTSPLAPSVASKVSSSQAVDTKVTAGATSQVTDLPPRNNISPPSTSATPILLPQGLVDPTKYKPPQSTVSTPTGVQTAVPIPGQVDPNKKPNDGLTVGTQPHSPMTLPAKIEDPQILNSQSGFNQKPSENTAQNDNKASLVDPIKPNINVPQNFAKPAPIHTPAVLPAQIMISKDNINMAANEKPAIQTPISLPQGQVDPNKKPALSVSTQPIHSPMTLPANVSPNNKPSLVDPVKIPSGGNVPQNKPAIHTPVTLPAQISNKNENVNSTPQNIAKPAPIHTPAILPAQIMNTKDNLNMAANEKLPIQTPVTLPLGQIDPNKKPALTVSTQPIHTPMTLPAQITQDKTENVNADLIKKPTPYYPGVASDSEDKIKSTENAKPATSISNEKKDEKVTTAEVKPEIHTPVTLPAQSNSAVNIKPVTLLPHISGDKKTETVISPAQTPQTLPGNSDKRAEVTTELKKPVAYYPSDKKVSLAASTSANLNIGGSAQVARVKRQYLHRPATLPARVPAGGFQNSGYGGGSSFNGGYQGIQPAIYNRPSGGHYRG